MSGVLAGLLLAGADAVPLEYCGDSLQLQPGDVEGCRTARWNLSLLLKLLR